MDRRFCVAPMMECTDRHFRYLLRLISRQAVLYTEMVHVGAVLHGDRGRFLDFHDSEHPLALQLGGNRPEELGKAALLAEHWGYDEVNLNVGCPSSRVQAGAFGACLMKDPVVVARCVEAMRCRTSLPVTVKTRIGVDERDSYEQLASFVGEVAIAGCATFIVHARKAWLNGLSPKQNREVPPLRYDLVVRLKADFPDLEIILNGGLQSLVEAKALTRTLDGVMLGREVYANPYLLAEVDALFYRIPGHRKTRKEILQDYLPYLEQQLQRGVPYRTLVRHLFGLFHGLPGARNWRRVLTAGVERRDAGVEWIKRAAGCVDESEVTEDVS